MIVSSDTMTHRRPALTRLLYLSALLASTACGSDVKTTILAANVDKAPQAAHHRRALSQAFDTASAFRLQLAYPLWVTANEAGAVVMNAGSGTLVAIDPAGTVRWKRSVRGLGGVRDIRIAADGRLLVLSGTQQRVVIYDDRGEPIDSVSVRDAGHVEQAMSTTSGEVLVVAIDSSAPFALVDHHGIVVRRYGIPWPGYKQLQPIARAGYAYLRQDGGWNYAFATGDRWVTFDAQGRLEAMAGYVEPVPFPDVIASQAGRSSGTRLVRHASAALAVQQLGDTLAILFGGARSTSGRFIDLYNSQNGAYLGSWLLPSRATTFAATRTRLYTASASGGEVVIYRRPYSQLANR